MDNLWKSAQYKADDLLIMLTDKTGAILGDERVNVRTGRIEGVFKREDVAINQYGDDALLMCGNWPDIELSLAEAYKIGALLQVKVNIPDD